MINQNHEFEKQTMKWLNRINELPWVLGSLDDSSWRAACLAARMKVADETTFQEIAARIERAGETVKAEKIWSQIQRAKLGGKPFFGRKPSRSRTKAEFNENALARIAGNLAVADPAAEIVSRSLCCPAYLSSSDALVHLYGPGEKVLIFEDQCRPGVLWERNHPDAVALPAGGENGVLFLINPVDGEEHWNPRQNKMSNRSEESVTAYRYALLESDKAGESDWLRLLLQLSVPIAAIYRSGRKSVHALLRIDAASKQEWAAMVQPYKPRLVRFGADAAALTAVRLSRLPQALRGERQQELLFINPNPVAAPIINMPTRPLWRDCIDYMELNVRNRRVTDDDRCWFYEAVAEHRDEPDVVRVMAMLEVQND